MLAWPQRDASRILLVNRMRSRLARFLVLSTGVSVAAGAVIACSAPAAKQDPIVVRDEDSGTKKKDTGTTDDRPPKPEEDPPLPDGGKPPGRIYAHTSDTLYLFEPLGKTLTKIGVLSCLNPGDRLLDVALDRDSVMYGTSDEGFLKIDPVDATCSYVMEDPSAQYPNSLAFVPLGTVDPTKETLVGYQFDPDAFNEATVYVKIDLVTGEMTKVGDLNDPTAAIKYRSSGDIVSMIRNGNKAYLTVKAVTPDAGTGNDYLAEIDPATGQIKNIVGDTGKRNLYGIGQWAGSVYGFNDTGDIIQINMTNASAKTITTLSDDGGVAAWFGAGMTTDAPTKP
ncbi:MAG: Peptidyl-prolyl cis-trans isomerase [Labilithrix sp.]|nr:Peptidyl-prolyl cis-trans isomerase [Labilithrix sp.]